jgi:hypothetical protein
LSFCFCIFCILILSSYDIHTLNQSG